MFFCFTVTVLSIHFGLRRSAVGTFTAPQPFFTGFNYRSQSREKGQIKSLKAFKVEEVDKKKCEQIAVIG